MVDSTVDTSELCDYLLDAYEELKGRLTRRLGCVEQAGDALQDVWIRLNARVGHNEIGNVQNPKAYLLRMAFNVVMDRQRVDSRLLSMEEVDSLLGLSDPGADPARCTEEWHALEALAAVVDRMPSRRKQILLTIRVDGLQQREVADRLGVSLRLVQRELKLAQEYMMARLNV